MTVKELRDLIEGVEDDTPVMVVTHAESGTTRSVYGGDFIEGQQSYLDGKPFVQLVLD